MPLSVKQPHGSGSGWAGGEGSDPKTAGHEKRQRYGDAGVRAQEVTGHREDCRAGRCSEPLLAGREQEGASAAPVPLTQGATWQAAMPENPPAAASPVTVR